MKKNSDDFNFAHAGGAEIGALLSTSLKESQSGECVSLEEIAVLVDGNASSSERDRIMSHLASCDRCYEVFLLTSDLREKKIIPMKRAFISFPVRLAASIIVAAFSLFLFYKIVFIPASRDKLAPKQEPGREAPALVLKEGYEIERREESLKKKKLETEESAFGLDAEMDKKAAGKKSGEAAAVEKRRGIPGSGERSKGEGIIEEKRIHKKGGIQPAEKGEFSGDEKKPGKVWAKAVGEKGTLKKSQKREERVDQQVTQQTEQQYQQTLEKDKQLDRNIALQDSQDLQRQKLQAQRQRESQQQQVAAQQYQFVQEKKDVTQQQTAVPGKAEQKGGRRVTKKIEPSAAQRVLAPSREETDTRRAVDRLNREISQYGAYIPGKEMEDFFKAVLVLAEKLEEEFAELNRKDFESDAFRKIGDQVKSLAPVMTVEAGRDSRFIFPNMIYFQKKSKPGTPEYRFFTLALSGWCDVRGCYGEIKGKVEIEVREELLKNWQELRLELTGIFLKIADRTINHLSK